MLLEAAERADSRLTTALLAVAAKVPVAVGGAGRAACAAPRRWSAWCGRPGSRCGWRAPVQALLGHLGPKQALAAGEEAGGFPLTAEEMRWQVDFLQHIGR